MSGDTVQRLAPLIAVFTLLAGAFAFPAAAQPAAPAPFVITDAKAIEVAESLFRDIDAVSRRVTPCVESGAGTPITCVCRFPAELQRLRENLSRVRAQYPAWETQVVNWTDPVTKQGRAISLQAIAKHANPACPAK
jgi:hypothetical protein